MTFPRILFTSLSDKIDLFRKVDSQAKIFNPKSIIIGADSNANCPAASKIKDFIEIPLISKWSLNEVLTFCELHAITHILPTRDGELRFWSSHSRSLKKAGISVMISDENCLRLCLDKLAFYQNWKSPQPLPVIQTTTNPDELNITRFVVKERIGSGSKNIGLNLNASEAKRHAKRLHSPVFQPFIKGREVSAETWIDAAGKCHGILLRWRLKVINGESHETVVFQDENLEKKVKACFENFRGIRGHCLMQLIVRPDGKVQVIEINLRMGGATPLAFYSGISSVLWFLLEESGKNELIPEKPQIKFGTKLSKINHNVTIQDPFPTRQSESIY